MSATRRTLDNGSPMERAHAYSRAVRVGNHITVGGTAAVGPDGETVGVGNAGAQTAHIIAIIADALERLGASLDDVTITRIILTDIEDWRAVAAERAKHFESSRPAMTITQVNRFVNPEWLVEIEAEAVVPTR